MEINEWVERCYRNAEEHGFIDQYRTFGHDIALVHSELSEALLAYRSEEPFFYVTEEGTPEGVAVELADAVMRIMTICGERGIDLEEVMERKYVYNRERPFLHGKRF